jgi:hypothetical protein
VTVTIRPGPCREIHCAAAALGNVESSQFRDWEICNSVVFSGRPYRHHAILLMSSNSSFNSCHLPVLYSARFLNKLVYKERTHQENLQVVLTTYFQ